MKTFSILFIIFFPGFLKLSMEENYCFSPVIDIPMVAMLSSICSGIVVFLIYGIFGIII